MAVGSDPGALVARLVNGLAGHVAPTAIREDSGGVNRDRVGRLDEYLLARGAGINAIPDYAGQQTALGAAGSVDTQRQILVDWLKERGAAEG